MLPVFEKVKRVKAHPKGRGKFSNTAAGFCLCEDDEFQTTIATPKGCGTEPVMCEKACLKPIVGKKMPMCLPSEKLQMQQCSAPGTFVLPSRALSLLITDLAKANGAPIRAKLPPGSRRALRTDFVLHGRRMSREAVKEIKRRVSLFLNTLPAYPAAGNTFNGRGIVMVGGNDAKYQASYYIAIHAIRRSGCTLPIQLWFPENEGPDCEHVDELRETGVTSHSFADLAPAAATNRGAAMDNRFMYKIMASMFSSVQEVLLMDSDNIVLADPTTLFSSDEYEEKGSILWMDFWRGNSAPDLHVVMGGNTRVNHTHESGQMLLNKRRTWEALCLAAFMNVHREIFYPLTVNYMGMGDKELISTAFLHLQKPYGMEQRGPDHVGVRVHDRTGTLGNTMLQHDMDGVPMFLHANLGKPTVSVPAEKQNYVRRWQVSNGHGLDLPRVINNAAGVGDFEMWYYETLKKHRCWFDGRPTKYWYKTLGFGPFLEGFYISDHPYVNYDLESTHGIVHAESTFG